LRAYQAIFTRPGTVPDIFRIPDRALHHALRPDVSDAVAVWGPLRYSYGTNSLGLRDAYDRASASARAALARADPCLTDATTGKITQSTICRGAS
jgi:hypothetical protein